MRETTVQILIISNQYDFSTDYIVKELLSKNISYCRINIDNLNHWRLTYDLLTEDPCLIAEKHNRYFIKASTLQSVYFRAPTFLRSSTKNISGQIKEQWATFYRNLLLFQNANWINPLNSTYQSEHKVYQLAVAKDLGFNIPRTIVSNNDSQVLQHFSDKEEVMLKSVGTLMFKKGNNDAFCYSTPTKLEELNSSAIDSMPVFIQEHLNPKIDYRVTVVNEDIFSVRVINNGAGILGDWRLMKDEVEFCPCDLPQDIKNKCLLLTKNLGLIFGAIDLVYANDQFYFIEINPTGEWGWLVESANQSIDKSIVKSLCAQ